MAEHTAIQPPRFEILAPSTPAKSRGWQWIRDGTAEITIGGPVAGGFAVEVWKSFIPHLTADWWAPTLGLLICLAALGDGFRRRRTAQRRNRVGIIVIAAKPGEKGRQFADTLERQATNDSQNTNTLTLKVRVDLTGENDRDTPQLDALATETFRAVDAVARLDPDLVAVNLIPEMQVHDAFRFGAQIGHSHARKIVLYKARAGEGNKPATYFPATTMRDEKSTEQPLVQENLERLRGGDKTIVALAVDAMASGDEFLTPVRTACRQYNVGTLILLRSTTSELAPNQRTLTAAVDQICRAWRDAKLDADARNGLRLVFFKGPAVIPLSMGGQLASQTPEKWIPMEYLSNGQYKPFQPSRPAEPSA